MTNRRSRNWCFTLNNPVPAERRVLLDVPLTDLQYYVAGDEVAPETGTLHLQGYCKWKNKKSLAAMKALLPRAHWEMCGGTPLQNEQYCKKNNSWIQRGAEPSLNIKKGAKATKEIWENAWQMAKEGRFEEIDAKIRTQYWSNILKIRKDFMVKPPDNDGCRGVWIWGPAGAGKSRKAREDYPDSYLKPVNKWWDGYQDEETVIMDDIDTNHGMLGHHLKIWADRYAFIAEIKGGAVYASPKVFCVTSQYSIEDIFQDVATRQALRRRFRVIHLDPRYQ